MAKPTTTRTLNPLPFDDLEPKRFEDLIRQLIYDFRRWRQLEATGRSGGDAGYDARGWEIVESDDFEHAVPSEEDNNQATSYLNSPDRKWMIQCKREKRIGPKKMKEYLEGIGSEAKEDLYGFIFAACCDFSLATRDYFRQWCRDAGMSEFHIWGRAEVEDMLFQPKNDHLLFAYFSISLQIRKRSMKSQVRARLAMKRKARRVFHPNQDVLLRGAESDEYPYRYAEQSRSEIPWKVTQFSKFHPQGILLQIASFRAYLDQNGRHWDVANLYSRLEDWHDGWLTEDEDRQNDELKEEIREFEQDNLDNDGIGEISINLLIPCEEIIDIDEEGDVEHFNGPYVYLDWERKKTFKCYCDIIIPARWETDEDNRSHLIAEKRVLQHPSGGPHPVFPEATRNGDCLMPSN